MMEGMSEVVVERVEATHHYELRRDTEVLGFTNYRDDGPWRVFINTQVSDDLADTLIVGALSDVKASGKRIVSLCPTITEWVITNKQFENLVDGPPVLEKRR
jgi:predicted GNAT family acetyltransferase